MNRCPNCSEILPEGEVVCPYCGQEIQLVPDYETLSTTLLRNQKMENEQLEQLEQDQKEAELFEAEEKYYKKNRRNKIILIIAVIAACAVTAVVLVNYWRTHSGTTIELDANGYYEQALAAFNNKEYEHANGLVTEALKLDSSLTDARILKARITNQLGNKYEAIVQLREIISDNPEAVEAYRCLIEIHQADDDFDSINELLDGSPETIRTALSDYISGAPIFSLESGTYNTEQNVTITSTGVRIYYTTDGSAPTKESMLYSEPIHLGIGYTQLKAVSETSTGVLSNVTEAAYTIDVNAPEAPTLSLPSGSYTGEEGMITITYPEGCTCYYAFDERPSKFSRRYTGPVQMLEGDHIFYAIAVNSDGVAGPITAATYIYTPAAETTAPEQTTPEEWIQPTEAPITDTPIYTDTPTAEPTQKPTATPEPKPTQTAAPTPEPTAEPTPEPTPEPVTEEPTPEPVTEEPTPEPEDEQIDT